MRPMLPVFSLQTRKIKQLTRMQRRISPDNWPKKKKGSLPFSLNTIDFLDLFSLSRFL